VGEDLSFGELDRFDAFFLSPGAGRSSSMGIEGEDLKKVWKGGEFLERIHSGDKIKTGKEIIVVGGGNTAMDVARSALRLGSRVMVAYRRTRAEMPAIQDEIREAEEEGVRFEFLIQPVEVALLKNRRIGVTFQRMRLRGKDQNNRRKAVPIRADYVTLEADGLISAVGEWVDPSSIPEGMAEKGLVKPGPSLSTGEKKVFAGGDAVDQPRTIVTAIASGKRAAISIDLHFRDMIAEEVLPRIRAGNRGSLSMEAYLQGRDEGKWPEPRGVASYDRMNTLFFHPSKRIEMQRLPPKEAVKKFAEVHAGFIKEEARVSALRCFSCGTCNYCYNCYFFCPEGVISLDSSRQTKTVDLDHCKGCGTCAKSCPRSVVQMKEAG